MFATKKRINSYIDALRIENVKYSEIPINIIRAIGKRICFSDYDGYNYGSCYQKLCYFDSLDRSRKEFFISQRLYMV